MTLAVYGCKICSTTCMKYWSIQVEYYFNWAIICLPNTCILYIASCKKTACIDMVIVGKCKLLLVTEVPLPAQSVTPSAAPSHCFRVSGFVGDKPIGSLYMWRSRKLWPSKCNQRQQTHRTQTHTTILYHLCHQHKVQYRHLPSHRQLMILRKNMDPPMGRSWGIYLSWQCKLEQKLVE